MPQGYLFVCGPSRSGTSAMANLLRAHELIALGRERFSWRFDREADFQPGLFTRERFCLTFHAEDSHHRQLDDYYPSAAGRFDACRYVGDKIPGLYLGYAMIRTRFPGAKIIYMAREIYGVASSFNFRARQTESRLQKDPQIDRSRLWPVDRDWQAAILEWNEAIRATLDVVPDPDLLIVSYPRLFIDSRLCDTLLAFLGLHQTDALVSQWREGGQLRASLEARRTSLLTAEMRAEIGRRADFAGFRQLMSFADEA